MLFISISFQFVSSLLFHTFPPLQQPVPKIIMTHMVSLSPSSTNGLSIPSLYKDQTSFTEITIGMKPPTANGLSISFDKIYEMLDTKTTIPSFHTYSRFHYEDIYQSRYGQTISYNEYCRIEDAVAKIIIAFLHDTKRDVHYVFVFPDDGWLESESIVSYMTLDEYKKTLRIANVNLDIPRELLPRREPVKNYYRIYTWDRRFHPFL